MNVAIIGYNEIIQNQIKAIYELRKNNDINIKYCIEAEENLYKFNNFFIYSEYNLTPIKYSNELLNSEITLENDNEFVYLLKQNDIDIMILDKTVNFVLINSEIYNHYHDIILLLEGSKHILCELPIVLSINELEKCYEIANSNCVLLEFNNYKRFLNEFQYIEGDIQDIGKLQQININIKEFPNYYANDIVKRGGIFFNKVIHELDLCNFIINDTLKSVNFITSNTNYENKFNYEFLDIYNVILKYDNDVVCILHFNNNYSEQEYDINMSGTLDNIYINTTIPKKNYDYMSNYYSGYFNKMELFIEKIINNYFFVNYNENVLENTNHINTYIIKNNEINYETYKRLLLGTKAIQMSYHMNKEIQYEEINDITSMMEFIPQRFNQILIENDNDYEEARRNYKPRITKLNVREHYRKMRMNQTVDYNFKIREYFMTKTKIKMTLWQAMECINDFTDVSDPDINLSNMYHLFQTAEGARWNGQPKWLQLTCLLHDMGKIMYLWGKDNMGTSMKEQWGIAGDTFVVGCKIPETVIYPEFNCLNKDYYDNRYNTKYGIYEEGYGLNNVLCSWGHDEYMFNVLTDRDNPNKLPNKALYCIRFHSLYLWHNCNEYEWLEDEYDKKYKKYVVLFNKYDLYTKEDEKIDIDELKEYYNRLFNEFFENEYIYF